MAAIVCEICGSNDIQKQDGFFVCQHCGTKYNLEEAKKLIGTVQVDKSQETEKLLVLARRAREDNNYENAEKYYGMVLQDDPNNWEAAFFQVLYHSMQCKIMNISSAAYDVANSMDSTLKLISELGDENERKDAVKTVCSYAITSANILANGAENHYRNHSSVNGAHTECSRRIVASKSIFSELEKALKKYNCDGDTIEFVQKELNSFLAKRKSYFNNNYFNTETSRLTSDIKKKDGTYIPPQPKGCYVATAVYGSYNCPEVWVLRRFRDYTLSETWCGRVFIKLYYSVSPTIVRWFGSTKWFKLMWKSKLDRLVVKLRKKGLADTPYQDRNW